VIRHFLHHKRIAVLCAMMALSGMWNSAFAQLDYDTYDIYQTLVGAERTMVGTIYVPQRATNQQIYAEYWVLFPKYVYPSVERPVTTEIVSSAGYHYTSLQDFFAKVPWSVGSRFVTVIAVDTNVLPGRTPSTVGGTVN
jgi:hypothetical protein